MNILFWQNCVSPHQLPYIKELHNDERVSKVILIAPVWELAERKKMGWDNTSCIEGIEIIIAPDKYLINNLFLEYKNDSVHLFSGIHADKFVFDCFKESLNYPVKRGIITEPPFDYNKPMFLHRIRFLIFDYIYISNFDYVFGMGDRAVKYYQSWSKSWKVFLFGYCVGNINYQASINYDSILKFVYVGSLIKLKNVSLIVKAIKEISPSQNINIDIIGDGPEYKNLLKQVEIYGLQNNITFLGKMPMKKVHESLPNYDVLVMPSIRDGWGAVINEGLQSGLFIVSSDNCGAKTLIEDSNRGMIFKNKDLYSLIEALKYCLINADEIKSGGMERIKWSEKISGLSMAKYMIDCLYGIDIVMPPWK